MFGSLLVLIRLPPSALVSNHLSKEIESRIKDPDFLAAEALLEKHGFGTLGITGRGPEFLRELGADLSGSLLSDREKSQLGAVLFVGWVVVGLFVVSLGGGYAWLRKRYGYH